MASFIVASRRPSCPFAITQNSICQGCTAKNDTPVFCTSSHELTYMKNGVISDRETEMMSVRWKVFHFHSQIPEKDQRSIKSCNKCFAELVLGAC